MIQRARPCDIPQVLDCLNSLHLESPEYGTEPKNKRYVQANLTRMLYLDHVLFYVSVDSGIVKGFYIATVQENWFAPTVTVFEQLLYVRPEYRGTPVAMRLVQSLERAAAALGATRVRAGVTTGVNNEKAISMYKRMGFDEVGTLVQKRIGG